VAESLLQEQVSPEALIAVAQQLLSIDRAHEGAWRALMRAHAERGERGMAIQSYDRCRTVLADLLDATPSPETQALLSEIRNGRSIRPVPVPLPAPVPVATLAVAPPPPEVSDVTDVVAESLGRRHDTWADAARQSVAAAAVGTASSLLGSLAVIALSARWVLRAAQDQAPSPVVLPAVVLGAALVLALAAVVAGRAGARWTGIVLTAASARVRTAGPASRNPPSAASCRPAVAAPTP
jgi:hypothetical protein